MDDDNNNDNDDDFTKGVFGLGHIRCYLQKYQEKLYPIWPVIDLPDLIDHLEKDPEQATLALSLCAATGVQLRLDEDLDRAESARRTCLFDQFAKEAERRRSQHDHCDSATVAGVLTSFFLHAYYSKKQKHRSSSLYIREAVTLAQLFGIDRETSYEGIASKEAHFRRKIFWLIFVSERGHSIQFGFTTILRPVIAMPTVTTDKHPDLLTGLLTLARMFIAVDGMLTGPGLDDPERALSSDTLEGLQRHLKIKPEFAPSSNEVQNTGIFVTQQWMRTLLWQLSMEKLSLTTLDPEHPLSLMYPVDVAKDTLSFLSHVSLESLVAHGPGMELKIFEIANTLLDVINIVPTLSTQSYLARQAPRDIFHALSCFLAEIGSKESSTIVLLQSKIAESDAVLNAIPRLVEFDHCTSSRDSGSFPETLSSDIRKDCTVVNLLSCEGPPIGEIGTHRLVSQPSLALLNDSQLGRHGSNAPGAPAAKFSSNSLISSFSDPVHTTSAGTGFSCPGTQLY